MGCCMRLKCIILQQNNIRYPTNIVVMLVFSFILMSHFTAQGRQFPDHANNLMKLDEMKMRFLIGSRPPRCDQRRCQSCGHCEPVQVPIASFAGAPKIKFFNQQITNLFSRGEDISNYKPMCWKCKCGDFFFNP